MKNIIELLAKLLSANNNILKQTFIDEIEIAISTLEKQIPKKPLKQKFGFFDFRLVCPECEQPIARYFNKKEYKPRYCHNCGQALDWSEHGLHNSVGQT